MKLSDLPKNTKLWVRATIVGSAFSSSIASGCAGSQDHYGPPAPTCGPCCHGDESACIADAARQKQFGDALAPRPDLAVAGPDLADAGADAAICPEDAGEPDCKH